MVFSVKHPTLTICAILVDFVKKPAFVVVSVFLFSFSIFTIIEFLYI